MSRRRHTHSRPHSSRQQNSTLWKTGHIAKSPVELAPYDCYSDGMKYLTSSIGALLFCSLLFSGCGKKNNDRTPAACASVATDAIVMANLPTEFPSEISMAEYAGQIHLLCVWLMNDPASFRSFQAYTNLPVPVIGAVADEMDTALIKADIRKRNLSVPIGRATTDITAQLGGIRAYPTSYLFDEQGKVARIYAGHEPVADIEEDIECLKAGEPLPDRNPPDEE